LRLQACKFALRPNGEQIRNLRQFAGSCRFVYNKALALNVERYEQKKKRLGYAGLCALLPNWKMEHEFLSAVPAQALQQALKNLERAYTNSFKNEPTSPSYAKLFSCYTSRRFCIMIVWLSVSGSRAGCLIQTLRCPNARQSRADAEK